MRFELPPGALEVLRRLNAAGYQAYAVGGCVRDLARGVPRMIMISAPARCLRRPSAALPASAWWKQGSSMAP